MSCMMYVCQTGLSTVLYTDEMLIAILEESERYIERYTSRDTNTGREEEHNMADKRSHILHNFLPS